jgi:hypothetical protein
VSPDISEIPALTDGDWQAFQNADIRTLEQLWMRIDALQAANSGQCLVGLNAATGIPQHRLATYLSAAAVLQAERYAGDSELSVHLRSIGFLAVAASILVLTLGLVRGKPVERVVASRRIEAFHPITAQDLIFKQGNAEPGALHDINSALGRYARTAIAVDSTIGESMLSSAPLDAADLARRRLISLTAKSLPSSALAKLPANVSLLFSPRTDSDAPVLIDDVLLLSTEQGSGLFAIPKPDMPKVEAVAGKNDIFVLMAAP